MKHDLRRKDHEFDNMPGLYYTCNAQTGMLVDSKDGKVTMEAQHDFTGDAKTLTIARTRWRDGKATMDQVVMETEAK